MSSSLLASLGVGLDEENLYSQLLVAVKEKKLRRDVVTNQFVSEISERMGEQRPGLLANNPGQMTVRQACHILAFLVDQVKFPSEDCINKQMKSQLWHKRDLDKLKVMMKEGSVRPGDPWPVLEKVFPFARKDDEEEAAEAKVPRLDQPLPFMCAAGFEGRHVKDVLSWLERWQPAAEELTNGLIDEFIGTYDEPAAVGALVTIILRVIGAKRDVDRDLKLRLRKMFLRTEAAWRSAGGSASDRWINLFKLESDPALFELLPSSLQMQLAARISSKATNSNILGCDRLGCQVLGNFRLRKVTRYHSLLYGGLTLFLGVFGQAVLLPGMQG